MGRKTMSMAIGSVIDEQLNELSAQYGLNKSSLINRILQRSLAGDNAIKDLMSTTLPDRGKTIKRSYRIEEDMVSFMEQFPDILMGTVIEKAVSQFMALSDEEKRNFLLYRFYWPDIWCSISENGKQMKRFVNIQKRS